MPTKKTSSTKAVTAKKTPAKLTGKAAPSLHVYRRVVMSFVVLAALLVVIIGYASFVSATISVIPKPQDVVVEFTVPVVEGTDGPAPEQMNGVFFQRAIEGEKQFPATGSQAAPSEIVGRVKLTNDYRRPQPLLATTRLLADNGILLHTTDRVDLPVGGSVEVNVYADDPAALSGQPLPAGTKLTLPALWVAIQDKIYATSITPIAVGEQKIMVVSADDLTNAQSSLLQQLEDQTMRDLGVDTKVAKAVTVVPQAVTPSAVADEATSQFSMKIKATISGVFFDRETLVRLAEKKLRQSLPADQQLLTASYDQLSYAIEQIDVAAKTATVKVTLPGVAVIRLNSDILAKDRLKGLTKQELDNYFKSQQLIQSIKVDFFPFWVKRVPQLLDHINIRVEGLE
ncbi:MAG: hypothetical protein AAB817_02340 [Patescibacteria group bacterium]